MNKSNFSFLLIVSMVILIKGCISKNQNSDVNRPDSLNNSQISLPEKVAFRIKRYETALFEIDKANLETNLKRLVPEFSVFLGSGDFTPDDINQISAFISSDINQDAYQEVKKQYPDLNSLTAGLNKAFENFARETGTKVLHQTYTYVSGFDFQYPVKYADSVIIIALDMFLGKDYEMYKKMGIPIYLSSRFTAEHIIPTCMKEMAYPFIPEQTGPYTLLDAMIEEGKLLYFAQKLLPGTNEHIIAGFNQNQHKWCIDNESNLWQFIIENELLYGTDSKSRSMFMVDGPFTSSFSQDSPARTGAWLGMQIVKSYMKKNNIPLTSLLANGSSREILEKSGYKPRKK
ncbi:MAG: hypothetical protein K0B15_02960 [Lentimicrobium sp.]|nr:hypothetical protein [Lentimicrobium sp.]